MKKSFKSLLSATLVLLLILSVTLPASAASTIGKVNSLQSHSIDDDEINLKWKKVPGATGYQIYIYKSNEWKHIGTTKKLSYEIDELASAKKYKLKVRAYKQSANKKVYGPFSSTLTAFTEPEEVENVKVSSKDKTYISLKWSKIQKSDGYQVYIYSTVKGKYVKKATVKEPKVTIKELKANTTYKFKIRAYYKNSSVTTYGDFSDVLSVKTAKASSASVKKNERKLISASEAVSIALKNAGLKKNQVRELSYELDTEKNVKVYEIEFDYGKYEYSYDINALNGKILHKEKERD